MSYYVCVCVCVMFTHINVSYCVRFCVWTTGPGYEICAIRKKER